MFSITVYIQSYFVLISGLPGSGCKRGRGLGAWVEKGKALRSTDR